MLKSVYDKKEDIPAGFESLYSEKGGKWVVTGIEGIKTQGDIDVLQTALQKERADHRAAKDALKAWGDLKPEEVLTQLDRIPELEAATGQVDETKLETIVAARVAQVKNPLDRELAKLKDDLKVLSTENTDLKNKDVTRTINDTLRAKAIDAKVRPEALDDILMIAGSQFELTQDGAVITRANSPLGAGMGPEIFFQDAQQKRPYFFPQSEGGGSQGSGPGGRFQNNPWSKNGWNVTEQGKAVTADRALAEQMAKSVGSNIGATAPPAN